MNARARIAGFAIVVTCAVLAPVAPALADNPPTATIEAASQVGVTSAKLSGHVNPQGEPGAGTTFWHFELSETGDPETFAIYGGGGTIEGAEAEAANSIAVTANAENLQPDTSYFVRLVAENGPTDPETGAFANRTVTEAPYPSFKTAPAVAPLLATTPATAVGYTLATLNGTVDPEGGNLNPASGGAVPINWQLEFREAGVFGPDEGWNYAGGGELTGTDAESENPVTVETPLGFNTLAHTKTYEVRLLAFYAAGGVAKSPDEPPPTSFTTLTVIPPAVTIENASVITGTSAHFEGEVTPGNDDEAFDSSCRFEYLTDSALGPHAEQQQLVVQAPGGTFTLAFARSESESPLTTEPIAFDAPAAGPGSVQSALEALANLDPGDLAVSGGPGERFGAKPYTIAFAGTLAAANLPAISPDSSGLIDQYGDELKASITTPVQGHADGSFEGASQLPCSADPVTGAGSTTVTADPAGLEPHTTYHFRLRAENLGGPTTADTSTFQTDPVAPAIADTFVGGVPISEATLNAKINPGGAATTYRFAYLTHAAFEADGDFSNATLTPATPLGGSPDNTVHHVFTTLTDLQPGTTYRYRVLATNVIDTTIGPGRAFHTFALPVAEPDTCPNAALRQAQHSAFLPDCRAYELVSPPDKNGGDVMTDSARIRTSLDGDAVTFPSLLGFGDVRGTGIATEYAALRSHSPHPGDNGWATHGIFPPQQSQSLITGFQGIQPYYLGEFSPDLAHGVFHAFSPLTDAPNVAEYSNLYLRDDLLTPGPGSYRLLTDSADPQPTPSISNFPGPAKPSFAAASADFSTLTFESRLNRLPGLQGKAQKLYLWHDGDLSLAGVLPGGTPATCLQDPATTCSIAGRGAKASEYTQLTNAVSADGSRLAFTAPSSPNSDVGALYQRLDGSSTIQLNASERTPPDQHQPARFEWATPDGLRVFFTTSEPLTDDDHNSAIDLYRYDAVASPGSHLTLISVDHEPTTAPGGTVGVVGISDDGAYVYFITADLLVGDTPGLSGANWGLYLWHDGQTSLVAPVWGSALEIDLDIPNSPGLGGRYEARVTPDGRHLLFTANNGAGVLSLRGGDDYDHVGFDQKYVYDAETDRLRCASCDPSGAPAIAQATASVRERTASAGSTSVVNRSLSADGRYVLFHTRASLLSAEDTNGKSDAYSYDTHTESLHLLSSGTDEFDSYFMAASADGHAAFIATRERLLGWDVDNAYDLYDVRVGGGFPEPPPLIDPCAGSDTCHGAAPTPPTVPPVSRLEGPVDPPPSRCPKGKHAARSHGKVRCVKNKRRNHGRRADRHDAGGAK